MNKNLDIYLTPIAQHKGSLQPGLYSLKVIEPSGKAIRGRKIDRLVLYLVMTGDLILRQDQQDQLLDYLGEFYYKQSGSATAAMRALAEELNKILLEINLRYAKKGQQVIGWMSVLVFREKQVYLINCGPMQAYFLKPAEILQMYDPSMVGQGLGQTRNTPVSFYHMQASAGDAIYLAAQPPAEWESGRGLDLHHLGPQEIEHRLDGRTYPDINLVVIQAREGSGNLFLTGGRQVFREANLAEDPSASEPVSSYQDHSGDGKDTPMPGTMLYEDGLGSDGVLEGDALSSAGNLSEIEAVETGTEADPTSANVPDRKEQQDARSPRIGLIWKSVVSAGTALFLFINRILGGVGSLFSSLLPDAELFFLPGGAMAFMAVVIPLVVVGLAGGVYFKLGRTAQFENYLAQAQEMAENAELQSDIVVQRNEWLTLINFLDQIETININSETQALRGLALSSLDAMDLVKRINYLPAIEGGLPESTNIIKVLAVENDLYMLDGNSGSVLHAMLTSQGYKPDPSFQCAPTIQGENLSGQIIDIETWPKGLAPEAEIITMDKSGKLLFCAPEKYPQTAVFSQPTISTMDNLAGMTISQGDIYILDPNSNAVWIYWNGRLESEPELFFDEEIPQLGDVIDLSVNNNELYLLHENGEVTLCVYSGIGVAPTRCSQPSYMDFRLGRENQPLKLENGFTQIIYNQPPDPSLYLLEPVTSSIYHFSLRQLAYQKQYLPLAEIGVGPVTAFAHDPVKRQFFLAAGDKMFYGLIP